MTKYEILKEEYSDLCIEERSMINKGLYADNCIWIKKELAENAKACVLAEEIGHYHYTVGDILDQSQISNAKQEHLARKWAYDKIVPFEDIFCALNNGHCEPYDMAEYLDVDEGFLKECLTYYGFL